MIFVFQLIDYKFVKVGFKFTLDFMFKTMKKMVREVDLKTDTFNQKNA